MLVLLSFVGVTSSFVPWPLSCEGVHVMIYFAVFCVFLQLVTWH